MADKCPLCGQPWPEEPTTAETTAELRQACADTGRHIFPGNRVDEATAAFLLGRSPATLRNWRCMGSPLPFFRPGSGRGRISYRLEDIAKLLGRCEE